MEQNDKIQLFEDKRIRTAWDEEKEEWFFSVVDAVGVLTGQPDARGASNYWAKLKQRLKEEGADQLLTNCQQLKMLSADGKRYKTDVATTEQLLRIIQSIPSPKAEPFKKWLAQVGRDRIEETIDPELTINRALETYLKKGYTREWINQRLQAIQVRKELTDEWQDRVAKKEKEQKDVSETKSNQTNGVKIHYWPHARVWLITGGSRFERERILEERFPGPIIYTGTFADSLIEAIAQGERAALRRQQYTSANLAAFTETGFLEGKVATTEEFCVALWKRYQQGKISVLTAEGFPDFLIKTFGVPEEVA